MAKIYAVSSTSSGRAANSPRSRSRMKPMPGGDKVLAAFQADLAAARSAK
jgi:hypothetical protein